MWGILVAVGAWVVVRWLWPRKRRTPPRSTTEQAQVRAGQVGENRATRILRQHGLTVWSDVRVASGGRTSQCDQIVVGPFGLCVIETKHWTGTLQRQGGSHWAQRKAGGSVHRYDSPESQNAYHCQVVHEVLRQHGLKRVAVYGAIVLSNPHAVFVSGPGPQPIGSPEEIAQWIQRLPTGRGFDAGRLERILRGSGQGVARATPWG
jgi:hypothetical protein